MSECDPKLAQAEELYKCCDPENRGYLTREDLSKLTVALQLDEEQLDAVFTSLDQDGDEHLTFEEFLDGLSPYLGATTASVDDTCSRKSSDGDESFSQSLQQVVATGVIEDLEQVQSVWKQLRNENPALLNEFEKLLGKLTEELVHSKTECDGLESALKRRINAHDEEVHRLYDEMESQIKQERERILSQEKMKEQEIKSYLENQLREKDKYLQDIMRDHEETQRKLEELNAFYGEATQKREELDAERERLESDLEETEVQLKECQDYIEVLNKKARDERRTRARAAMELSEGIALERESLVRQLNELREMNRCLRDERDEEILKMGVMSCGRRSFEGGERASSLIRAFQRPSFEKAAINSSMTSTASSRKGSTMDAYFSSILTRDKSVNDEGNLCSDECSIDEIQPVKNVFSITKQMSSSDELMTSTISSVPKRSTPDGAADLNMIIEGMVDLFYINTTK